MNSYGMGCSILNESTYQLTEDEFGNNPLTNLNSSESIFTITELEVWQIEEIL
jgi:hypothetical protein